MIANPIPGAGLTEPFTAATDKPIPSNDVSETQRKDDVQDKDSQGPDQETPLPHASRHTLRFSKAENGEPGLVIQVIEEQTGEVVREIPWDAARNYGAGRLFDLLA